jgi:o-succinylbenzoate---CoA ligase
VPSLIALALPPGPAFVEALRRTWDAGDAILPLDRRLPRPALDALLDRLAPAAVIDELGELHRRPDGGRPVVDGDALVVATSGTTGEPKGVVLSHDAVAASAEATSARLGIDPSRDRWLCCLPVAHVGGLSVITRALHTKTPLDVHPFFDADAVMAAVRPSGGERTRSDRAVTRVSLVATALARIDPAPFTTILLGGAAPPGQLPANAVVTYGMTETGSGVVYDGRPLDGVEVRVVDGVIEVRAPMLLRAYRDGRGETDPRDADGWFATGDAGEIDDEGLVVVHGRVGDLIVTGGEKVWPVVVEAALSGHPAVAEVMVVGRPDPEWGNVVAAVVVPSDPAAPPRLDELRAQVRATLPAYCAPKRLDVVTALPRTTTGKVKRRAAT